MAPGATCYGDGASRILVRMRAYVAGLAAALFLVSTESAFAQAPAAKPAGTPSSAPASANAPGTTPGAPKQTESENLAEAKARYQRCTELFSDGDFKLALIECERTYELTPIPRIQYNIGQINLQLNHYAAALRNFERYLKDDTDVAPERRKQVEDDIRTLRARTAMIKFVVNIPEAEVSIDDQAPIPALRDELVLTDAGTRKIVVQKEGFVPVTKTLKLAGGDTITLDIVLRPVETSRPKEQQGLSPLIYAGWGGTALFAGSAIVTGVLASGKRSDADALATPGSLATTVEAAREQSAAYDSAKSSMKTLALVSDIFTVSAIALGGVSLYFTVKGVSSKEKGAPKPKAARIDVAPTAGGLVVLGAF